MILKGSESSLMKFNLNRANIRWQPREIPTMTCRHIRIMMVLVCQAGKRLLASLQSPMEKTKNMSSGILRFSLKLRAAKSMC